MENQTGNSRRNFLKNVGLAGIGTVLATGVALNGCQAADQEQPDANAKITTVATRTFGKTENKVSCLALGGMFDIPNNQMMLKKALEWGVTYWDTADCYGGGKSELGIGKYFKQNPEVRDRVFLVSKSDRRDTEGMSILLDQSLSRMHTSYVNLYFVHGISSIGELNDQTKAWAQKAKEEGKIKLFGFSTHSNMEDCMLGAAKLDWIDGIMMTYNYRLMHTNKMKDAVDACTQAGIGMTAMKTQGGGQVNIDNETELKLAGRFLQQGFTDKQAKLLAVWEETKIASICSQMPNLTILMANVAAALRKPKLSSVDKQLLEQYAMETSCGYCAGCTNICEPAMAYKAPVGDVMRYLMYYQSYGDRDDARQMFAALPADVRDNLPHMDYSAAEKLCPQRMPIAKLMKEASQILS